MTTTKKTSYFWAASEGSGGYTSPVRVPGNDMEPVTSLEALARQRDELPRAWSWEARKDDDSPLTEAEHDQLSRLFDSMNEAEYLAGK